MANFAQGVFKPVNRNKYVGRGDPRYRSGWEFAFFQFCDNNDHVLEWASEAISIKYRHPLTGKITSYVPDIFMRYRTKNNKVCTEIIEIKPKKQTTMQEARSERDKLVVAVNMAKWAAATTWCKRAGIVFRVLDETQLFHNGGRKKR
jgi:hypothetical protein